MSIFEGRTHAELRTHEATLSRVLSKLPMHGSFGVVMGRVTLESMLREIRRLLAEPEQCEGTTDDEPKEEP